VSEEFNRRLHTAKSILDLDLLVIQALFAPAIRAGVFESGEFSWMRPDCNDAENAFIDDLLPLSQYYTDKNPVLSAAIWSIWDSLRTLETPFVVFSWIPMFFSFLSKNRWTKRRRISVFQGLVATTAIRFSSGKVPADLILRPLDNFQGYSDQVQQAIRNLSRITDAATT
jgi:hypothetical protein